MRVVYLAMILCPSEVDRAKAVQMAVIHDLAESEVGDITPDDGVTAQDKYSRENAAWTHISKSLGSDEQQRLWQEMEEGVTNEAKFVFQLDKLEMLIQADEYERLQPRLDLSPFFKGYEGYDHFFTFATTQEVYNTLRARRMAAGKE
jgi:putative hydrolase of HD superfamily